MTDAGPDARRQSVLARVDRFARLMDSEFTVPFTRFRIGLEPIIGLLPGVGDAAGLVLSSYLLVEAQRAGAPAALKLRMCGNMAIDAVGGLLPGVGDLFDAWFQANTRNARLLRHWLSQQLPQNQSQAPEAQQAPQRAPAWLWLLLAASSTSLVAVLYYWPEVYAWLPLP